MGVFDHFPYTNFHELNLMWILEALKEIQTTTDQFVAINSLKYADPIQWDITSQYEKNTIVIHPRTGTAYISVQPVPSGVGIDNTDYWTVVFDLGSFITRAAQNFTSNYEDEDTTTATIPLNVNDWLVWGDTLYRVLSPIIAGDQYVIGSNIETFTIEDVVGHIQDLTTQDTSNLVAALNEVDTIAVETEQKMLNLQLYNVKDYGAVGDGVTDDTAAIIACLDANHFAYFPIGTYIISSTIFIDTGYCIVGEDKQSTIIKQANNANIDMIKTVGFDSLKGTDNHDNKQIKITIKNITINGNYREDPDDFNIGVINNTIGTGLCMYCGGVYIENVTIYNCPDDGFYSEWGSYLQGSIVATSQECRYHALTIKCCGKNGWNFNGPHDSQIVSLVCATNNRLNSGYHNMRVGRGGFKMTGSHLYSDYGQPKVSASMYVETAADPLVVANSDIEGAGDYNLVLGSSNNLFANCRFYVAYGKADIYISPLSAHNTFIGCYCADQATEPGLVNPTWRGAVEFSDALPTYCLFDLVLINTHACDYIAGRKYNQWMLHGYNTQYQLDGHERAIPDIFTYTDWQADNIIINGNFDDQQNLCWLNTRTELNSMKYDPVLNQPNYFDGANYVGMLNYMKYNNLSGGTIYFDGANFVGIPNETRYDPVNKNIKYFDGANFVGILNEIRYDSGSSTLIYFDGANWVTVPLTATNVRYDSVNRKYQYFDGNNWTDVPTNANTVRYDSVSGMYQYYDGANWVGMLNDVKYDSVSGVMQFFDGAQFVTPNGAVRYNIGSSQLEYCNNGVWTAV